MEPAQPHAPATARCGLAAFARARLPFDEVASLRKQPPLGLPPALLKHADEQTVAAFAAVARAGLPPPYPGWGAVAAPRFIGRLIVAAQVPRFLAEGAWGISPHVIPHRSLHSLSGTLSQALRLHGPNFGAGGGPGALAEGLRAAAALVLEQGVPGVWFVATRLDPEGPLDPATGQPVGDCWAEAVALALVAPASPLARRHLAWDIASGEPDLLALAGEPPGATRPGPTPPLAAEPLAPSWSALP